MIAGALTLLVYFITLFISFFFIDLNSELDWFMEGNVIFFVIVIPASVFLLGIIISINEAVHTHRTSINIEENKKRWRLQEQAAEYDRLRDQEWKDLGWEGD